MKKITQTVSQPFLRHAITVHCSDFSVSVMGTSHKHLDRSNSTLSHFLVGHWVVSKASIWFKGLLSTPISKSVIPSSIGSGNNVKILFLNLIYTFWRAQAFAKSARSLHKFEDGPNRPKSGLCRGVKKFFPSLAAGLTNLGPVGH